MTDYQTTPVYRERHRRNRLTVLQTAARVALVFFMACIVSAALISLLILMLALLPGCTTLTAEQQRELAAQAKGCYCTAKNCEEIKSASGSAAIAAAGGQVVNITKVERPSNQ